MAQGQTDTPRDEGPRAGRLVSILIPAYNEEDNIVRLEEELLSAICGLPFEFDFIVVDNASTDRTGHLVKEICQRDRRWEYLEFSRNFTLEISVTAGSPELLTRIKIKSLSPKVCGMVGRQEILNELGGLACL